MDHRTERFADVADLADAVLDGTAARAAIDRLESLLVDDPDARAFYLDYTAMHADNAWERRSVSAPATAAPAARAGRSNRGILRSFSEAGPVTWSLAAALLLSAAAVALYIFVFSEHRTSNIEDRTSASPIATLIESTGTLMVDDDIARPGSEYAGGAYTLDSGSAQFLLRNRVTVDLTGPTRLLVHHPMRASLVEGTATFECPPGTEGFTVNLPAGAYVVDRGTRFTVSIKDTGLVEVWVELGYIDVHASGLPADRQHLALHAGQHAELDGATGDLIRAYEPIRLAGASFEDARVSGHSTTPPPGWSTNGAGKIGIAREGIGGFEKPAGDAPDGEYWMYLADGATATQPIEAELVAGDRVRVAFTQFDQTNIRDSSGVSVELWAGDPEAGGVRIDQAVFPNAGVGNQVQRRADFDLTARPAQPLLITLRAVPAAGNPAANSNASIDDLRVSRTIYQRESDRLDTSHENEKPTTSPERSESR